MTDTPEPNPEPKPEGITLTGDMTYTGWPGEPIPPVPSPLPRLKPKSKEIRMKRFQVHGSRPYRDDDLSLPRVFVVTANRFETRGNWLVFMDDKNNDVAIFSQNEITGAVPVDDNAVAPITAIAARPISDLA